MSHKHNSVPEKLSQLYNITDRDRREFVPGLEAFGPDLGAISSYTAILIPQS
jgi:hypothetical protein